MRFFYNVCGTPTVKMAGQYGNWKVQVIITGKNRTQQLVKAIATHSFGNGSRMGNKGSPLFAGSLYMLLLSNRLHISSHSEKDEPCQYH